MRLTFTEELAQLEASLQEEATSCCALSARR